MDWLEQELRRALQRQEPSPDFAGRVLARTRRTRYASVRQWLAAAAAVVIIAGGAGFGYRQHQGNAAKAQVMEAMRIAAATVNQIQAHVQEAVQ